MPGTAGRRQHSSFFGSLIGTRLPCCVFANRTNQASIPRSRVAAPRSTRCRLSYRAALVRRVAWGLGMLRGLPPWATDCRSAEYAERLARMLDEWRPDIVEIHLQAMAQYVDAAAKRNVPRILVDYDPPSAWAEDVLKTTRGTPPPRPLGRSRRLAALRACDAQALRCNRRVRRAGPGRD